MKKFFHFFLTVKLEFVCCLICIILTSSDRFLSELMCPLSEYSKTQAHRQHITSSPEFIGEGRSFRGRRRSSFETEIDFKSNSTQSLIYIFYIFFHVDSHSLLPLTLSASFEFQIDFVELIFFIACSSFHFLSDP